MGVREVSLVAYSAFSMRPLEVISTLRGRERKPYQTVSRTISVCYHVIGADAPPTSAYRSGRQPVSRVEDLTGLSDPGAGEGGGGKTRASLGSHSNVRICRCLPAECRNYG